MTTGLNSPQDVYFFTKKPDQYTLPHWPYGHEISRAQEHYLERAKDEVRKSARLEMVQFGEPTVDVQGKEYTYIIRSSASRDNFKTVMSPENLYDAKGKGTGIRGLHYSANETYGDAIGITIQAETPEEAKEKFYAWNALVKEALKALADRFAIVNKELNQRIEEMAAKRLDELKRAKKAL